MLQNRPYRPVVHQQRLNILVGTSGDTGPSAIEAIRDKENMSIVCLYPLGHVR